MRRDGVAHWHDGKPVTGDDVLYTLGRLDANGLLPIPAALDLKKTRRVSPKELVFALNFPMYDVKPALYGSFSPSLPAGTTSFTHPLGSGPFEFKSYTPGTGGTFVRNTEYSETGHPYLDEIKDVGRP